MPGVLVCWERTERQNVLSQQTNSPDAKSDKKTALVDRFLEKKAGIENPADSLKPKDWVKYVEQKVATNLKADEEKTEKKQHENARSNPVLSKLLRPSGSDVTAVKPADLERVSSQHFRQPEQQVEGYIGRYGRSSHVDNVMKMQEVMRHVSEISREDQRGDAADRVPKFLRGHNAVQSGSRHDAHEGHAPMVDPEEEKGHEHPYPGVLTGKHSESLHHGLKQTLQGLEHAKAEEASRGSGHEVHAHQKHQESIHGRKPHPVGEELDNAKKQAEESEAKADPTPEAANQEEDAGAAEASSLLEKIRLMQEMTKTQAEESEVTGQEGSSSTSDEGDAENAVPAPSETGQEEDTNDAQEDDTDEAGAAAANSIVEKIQMMRKMAALAKASSSENADPPSDAQADLDDAGAAEASSIVEKIQMMQRMAALAKMMKKMREGSEEEKEEALEEAKEVLPPEVLSVIKSKLDQEQGDMDKDAVETAERPSPSPLVREKLRQSGRLHPVNKEDKASDEEKQTEGSGAREENPGQTEGKAPERPSIHESPAEPDEGVARPAEHSTLSSLRKESLRESGRLVTDDKTAPDDANPTEENSEDHKTDAMQSKKEGEPTMEESPKIILHSGEKDQTTETNEETAANSDGPAKALGAIMKAMAIAKAQQDTSASTVVKDQASEDSKPALSPESIEKKLQVIQAIKHATELANGHEKQPASIEADDTSKTNEEENPEIDNDHSALKAVTEEEPTSHGEEEAARALEEAIKKAVAIAKEGRQETEASAEAKTPEPVIESQQPPLTPENKEKELQAMEAIRHAMEFAKRREESSASMEAEGQVAKALTAEPTVNAENKEEEDQEIGNNDEASKTAQSQDDKLGSDQNAFNVLQQVSELRKRKHMTSDEASKNGVEENQKESNIVDDIGSIDRIANIKPQDEALKDQSKEEKAKRVLDTMAELQAAASNQKKQLNSEEAIAKTEEEKSEDNNLGSRSQAEQAIMETIGKIRQEADERAHVQETDDPTPETTQAAKGKDIDESDQEPVVNTESSGPDSSLEAAVQEEDKGDVETDEASRILEKIQLMQKMAALAKVVKKMKDGSEEEKEEALEEAKEMLPPEILSVVQAKIAEESGNQENEKDDMEEETAGESSEAKVEEEIDENLDTQEAEEDTEEERTGEEAGGNIEEDEENVQFKKVESVEGLNLAVAEPEEHLGGTEKGEQTRKESGEENLSKGMEESLADDKNEENLTEESQILGDVDKAQSVINPQDQDERKFKDSLIEDEDDLSLETSEESTQRAEEHIKTVQDKEDTNGDQNDKDEDPGETKERDQLTRLAKIKATLTHLQGLEVTTIEERAQRAEEHIKTGQDTEEGKNNDQNDQEDEDAGETKEEDPLTRLAKIKATLTHLQALDEEQQDQKPDVTGKEEEDNVAPVESLLPEKSADNSMRTKNGKIETRTTQFQETELDEKKNEGEVNVRASQKTAATVEELLPQKPTDDSMTTKNGKTEARITHDQLQEPENDDEKLTEGEGNEVEPVRASLSQKAAAAEKVQRKALIAAGIAQSHLKAHGIKAPKSQEQPNEHKHLKEDATSVKKTTYYLSEEGKLRSSDEVQKEDKKQKILKIKNNLLSEGVAKTSQETLEEVNSGGDQVKNPEEFFNVGKETERSIENKGLKPASPFLQGAFMAHNTALQGKPDKEHPQSSDRTSKIPPYYLSKEKVMKSSKEFLEEEVLSVGKEEKSPVRPLPKDLARKNKISDKGTKGKISKEVLLTMEDKKKVRSDEKKLTGPLSNAADVKKENKTKLDKETKTKTGLKMSAKPKSLFGKAVKAGKHRNLAKLREMAMAMARKRRLPRGRRIALSSRRSGYQARWKLQTTMLRRQQSPILSALLLGAWFASARGDPVPVVGTTTATIRGVTKRFTGAGLSRDVHIFKGLPYAEPPVGRLRFRPPRPLSLVGEVDARSFGMVCPQSGYGGPDVPDPSAQSEDCLTLNVYVPKPADESVPAAKFPFYANASIMASLCSRRRTALLQHQRAGHVRNGQPGLASPQDGAVMVWIHGGAFQMGSGSGYDATALAAVGDVIVVTFNYRLGPLGFLSTGDSVSPGNFGMLDQVEVLTWVQGNIRAFGGDPDKVTIFGESAGGASVGMHLTSPASRGLFSRAIMQSGTGLTDFAFRPSGVADAMSLAEQLACNTSSSHTVVSCLREVEAQVLVNAQPQQMLKAKWIPVLDANFLPRSPRDAFQDGDFQRSAILLGTASDEGALMLMMEQPTFLSLQNPGISRSDYESIVANWARYMYGDAADLVKEAVLYRYTDWSDDSESANRVQYIRQTTDFYFVCPTNEIARIYAGAGENVYMYQLTHRSGASNTPPWVGVRHADDVQYVFGFPLLPPYDLPEYELRDETLAINVMRFWSNFAHTGNPNRNADGSRHDDITRWPKFLTNGTNSLAYKKLEPGLPNGRALRAEFCAFWDRYIPHVLNIDSANRAKRCGKSEKMSNGENFDMKRCEKSTFFSGDGTVPGAWSR
ncbi:hypothetical protein Bbelb_251450 [Branchiostoma belcheri]|nr:hypothetical protein Bbelb_251450 [Branchiostoma belcheri]